MKKILVLILSAIMAVMVFAACTNSKKEKESSSEETTYEKIQNTDVEINVVALKGPTGMGMAYLNDQSDNGLTRYRYDITYAASPDEITGGIIGGQYQIAAVPANLASVLFNKTDGAVLTCAVNTLGVLYVVESPALAQNDEIKSIDDLKGKTIVGYGAGSTPEYILNYILDKNNLLGQVNVDLSMSEHAEAITQMAQGNADVILIPEPMVTNCLANVEGSKIALDLTKEWAKVSDGECVQGVLVVQKDFAENHKEVLDTFLEEYKTSVEFTNSNPDEASVIIEKYGIVAKAALAKKAIPNCNIVCITGDDMVKSLDGMLEVLYNENPKSVGGSISDEMYYR